jgi:chorismate mutase / prephenate dehydratase
MSTFSLISLGRDSSTMRPYGEDTMLPTSSDLTELRRRLDEIDDKLHDLLIERAEIVSVVAASKREGNLAAFQPGREAQIVRRLVDRHHGEFPVATLVRMWRELLAATVRLQSPFAVAVFAPSESQGFWDLARDHYGSHTPMSAYRSIGQVIRAVTEGQAAVGVLPMPQEGETDPWWRHLLSKDKDAPRVVARLPFGARGNARSDGADALAIGRGVQQETGRDRVLLAAESSADISRGRIFRTLSSLGLLCTFFASYEHAGSALNLIEIEGFVPITDPRLDSFRAQLGSELHRLLPFGGYAIPLSATALAKSGPGLAGCSAGAVKN